MSTYSSDFDLDITDESGATIDVADSTVETNIRLKIYEAERIEAEIYLTPDQAIRVAQSLMDRAEYVRRRDPGMVSP